MAYFGKEFKFEKQENFVELVSSFDIPQEMKDKLVNSKSTAKIEKNADGSYSLTSVSHSGPRVTNFKVGVETEETIGNMKVKSSFSVDGNKVTQKLTAGDNELTIIREFSDNELLVTIKSSAIEAKRWYKA